MARDTWNPNTPEAIGLEFTGVGNTPYSYPATGLTQRVLRFTCQQSGPVDAVTFYLGATTNVPVLAPPGNILAGHRTPYVVELMPYTSVSTGRGHVAEFISSSVVASVNARRVVNGVAGGAPTGDDLAGAGDTYVAPVANGAVTVDVEFPDAATFPLNLQVISVAIEYDVFAANFRARRLGDGNVALNTLWNRTIPGGTANFHLGEFWIENNDTALWHEVTPTMIRQFAAAVGNRRMRIERVNLTAGMAWLQYTIHVDHLPERRIGMGILEPPGANQAITVPLHAPGATGTPPVLTAGTEYALVMRSAYGGDEYAGAANLDLRSLKDFRFNVGTGFLAFPSLDWNLHTTTGYPVGASISGLQTVGVRQQGLPTASLSITGSPTKDSQPYIRTVGARVYSGTNAQQIDVVNPSPSTEYRSIQLNLSTHFVPTESLVVTFSATATGAPIAGPFEITPEEVMFGPPTSPGGPPSTPVLNNIDELNHKYRLMTIDFGVGLNLPSVYTINLSSSTGSTHPWLVAALASASNTQTYDSGGASYASIVSQDPPTLQVFPSPPFGAADLEFILYTQAPEVTGLDVDVLDRAAFGATCFHEVGPPTPNTYTESFNKANGSMGPDLEWHSEAFDWPFKWEVLSNKARFEADQPGEWEDIQIPTPNITSSNTRISMDVTDLNRVGTGVYSVGGGAVGRLQLTDEGDDYEGYAFEFARANIFFPMAGDLWDLVIWKVEGKLNPSVLAVDFLTAADVALPAQWSVTMDGDLLTIEMTHSGPGRTMRCSVRDSQFRAGLSGLGGGIVLEDDDTGNLSIDNYQVSEILTGCETCVTPQITYPNVCWSPSELPVEDIAFYEVQRSEDSGPFETVAAFAPQETSTMSVGTTNTSAASETNHVAPSVLSVGDELLFTHWHAWTGAGNYNMAGSGMNPLGNSLWVPAVTGTGFQTTDKLEFSVTDLDVRAKVALADWTPPSGFFPMSIVNQGTTVGNIGWGFGLSLTGALAFFYTTDGSAITSRTSTVATGFTDGTPHWIRVTLDANNGAGQNVIRFYTSEDGVTWTQLGATVTNAGVIDLFDSTAPLLIGSNIAATNFQVYYLEYRNAIDGDVIASADFHSQEQGVTSFVDHVFNTWTQVGTAGILNTAEIDGPTPSTTSIAGWEQVGPEATGERTAVFSAGRAWAALSLLVRGRLGPPVIEEIRSGAGINGVTVGTTEFVKQNQWLLAICGTTGGDATVLGPPTPLGEHWIEITDSGDTNNLHPRVKAWMRPVIAEGQQVVTVPATTDPSAPKDYHLRVVVLSNVESVLSTCYEDWSVPYGQEACYRVRQVRSDGSISDWSTPVCSVVAPPAGVDLVITAPTAPELNAAYSEVHEGLPVEREYQFLDAADTTYQTVYGRDNHLAFRPTELRGVQLDRTLLVSPRCQVALPCLDAVKPLLDLMTADVEYLVVRDTCGNRWFASITVPTATQFTEPGMTDLWTANMKMLELSKPIFAELPDVT